MTAREALLLRAVRPRWAGLWRRVFEVEPLRCLICPGPMWVLALLTGRAGIDCILTRWAGGLLG